MVIKMGPRKAVDEEASFWPSTSGGPAIDIGETADHVIMTAELPGLDKNEFKVEVTENHLVIRGDKKQFYAKVALGDVEKTAKVLGAISRQRRIN
jgi:HSP20 family molecular chaperone IbpA